MQPKQPPIDNEFVSPGCELFASRPPPMRQQNLDLPTSIAERYAWMFGKNIEWRDAEAEAIRKMVNDASLAIVSALVRLRCEATHYKNTQRGQSHLVDALAQANKALAQYGTGSNTQLRDADRRSL